MCQQCFLKGVWSVNCILCLIRVVLPRFRSLCTNRCSPFSSSSLACSCSDSDHSVSPLMSKASKIHPFGAVLPVFFGSPGQMDHQWHSIGRDACTTTAFVGISKAHALKLCMQTVTLEEPGCSSP